ncbi:MAG: hypothetical protein SGJ24_14975 [Chloroflexota bacterium]|nr:hypothetical protein [Chloroflexota bacterium]
MDEQIRKLISGIFTQHADDSEMDCESCGQHFCRLADLVRQGAAIELLLPEVEHHLACCAECTEEFQALLTMIAAQNTELVSKE